MHVSQATATPSLSSTIQDGQTSARQIALDRCMSSYLATSSNCLQLLTSRAPFIIHPRVPREFDFRCLRENRRVVQDESRRAELDFFHKVLTDISQGDASNDVRAFIADAYVRGYKVGCAEDVPFEGSTAIFSKRRYRDKWNRTVVRRIAKVHNHSIKIKAKVRPRGVRSQQWYSDQRVAYLRK